MGTTARSTVEQGSGKGRLFRENGEPPWPKLSLLCLLLSLSLDDDDITVKRRRRKIAVVTENCDCYSFLVGGGPEEGGRVIERDRNEQRTL